METKQGAGGRLGFLRLSRSLQAPGSSKLPHRNQGSPHTGVPRSYETCPPQDPTLAICLETCGDPRVVGVSDERSTPVRLASPPQEDTVRCRSLGDSHYCQVLHGGSGTKPVLSSNHPGTHPAWIGNGFQETATVGLLTAPSASCYQSSP